MSRILGGRDIILDSPAVEVMQFMDMALQEDERKAEKERERYWINYLSTLFAQLPNGEESFERRQAREKFVHLIGPKEEPKQYEWNIPEEEIKKLEAMKFDPQKGQKGG